MADRRSQGIAGRIPASLIDRGIAPEARTVTVGGGVTADALDRALDGTGLALNLPVPSRIGVAGAALSGGVGVLLRRLGFIGDRIVAARLVDGTGTVRQVDERRDP